MSDSRTMYPDDQSDHRSKAGVVRSRLRRRTTRPMVVGIALVAGGLLAAACGSATTASPHDARSSSTHSAASAPPVIKTMTGTLGTYLVNATGMTLYRFTADSGRMSNCTGTCAAVWTPLTIASTTTPTVTSGLMGTLGTITRSDGSMQVTYNGSPLYTFEGDKASGDTNGQGLMGKWFVETVKTGAAPATTSPSRTGSSSGGYRY